MGLLTRNRDYAFIPNKLVAKIAMEAIIGKVIATAKINLLCKVIIAANSLQTVREANLNKGRNKIV